MIKKLFVLLKKNILGFMMLFFYNTLLSSLNVIIPINIFTILIVSLLDVPGIIGLVLILLLY